MRTTVSALLLASAFASEPASAGEGPTDAEVQQAIDGGVAWVKERFAAGFTDDTWHAPTELVVLALAHSGSNLTDPFFAKAVALVEKAKPRFTYRTSLLAMALERLNPRLYQSRIAHCAQWLVDTQLAAGEWGYPGAHEGSYLKTEGYVVPPPPPPDDGKAADAPRERILIERRIPVTAHAGVKGDFSNSQFAVLGLRACRDAGVHVPKETWTAALGYLKANQRVDGGWGYVLRGAPDEVSYSSLTAAGVCSAAICLHALGTNDVKADPTLKRGLAWLSKHLDLSKNVGIDTSAVLGPRPWQYYHLYSVERAARVLSLTEIGGRAWYAKGARWLVDRKQSDGSWVDEAGVGPQPSYFHVADTCFALLFLTRATRSLSEK